MYRPRLEVTRIRKKLKPKERLFCRCYADTGDAVRSAREAGFKKDAKLVSGRLLCDEAILEEISRLLSLRQRTLARMAAVGYRKLAFGKITDALRLLYAEQPDEGELEGMDLFMASDIRRNKDGMLEIKFFDRLKALEKLESAVREDGAGVSGLMEAIGRGARAAGGGDDD